MKTFTLAPEIYTDKFNESVQFYCDLLGFQPKTAAGGFQEMEGFAVLVHKLDPSCVLYICEANSEAVNEIFRPSFHGQGLIFQVEVDDVDAVYDLMKKHNVTIALEMIEDPGNGRHFAVKDPSGILIDIVQF